MLLAGLSPWGDSRADAGAPMGKTDTQNEPATHTPSHEQGASSFVQPEFIDKKLMAHQQQQQQQRQYPVPVGMGLAPVVVDRRTSPSVDQGGGGLPLVPTQAVASLGLDDLVLSSEVRAKSPAFLGTGVSPSSANGEASGFQSPAAADLRILGKPAQEARFNVVAPPGTGESVAGLTTSPQGEAGSSADAAASATMMVSAAVSEDLAYVHRGSVLQSYAITGSVLVAASHGARARLRVIDRQGHIANSTANAAVAAENTASSIPPTREYMCKAGAVEPAGEPPKFLPALMYRCSPAVKVLPVRVTCRLRSVGNSVLVSAQVIANPQLSQPLSGVSVLVNLPFSPRNEEVRFGFIVGGRLLGALLFTARGSLSNVLVQMCLPSCAVRESARPDSDVTSKCPPNTQRDYDPPVEVSTRACL